VSPIGALPKVAICLPTTGIVQSATVVSLFALALASHRECAQLEILEIEACTVARNRNRLAEWAMQRHADFVLFIDADMTFPNNALARLLSHRKDIVGATYCRRSPPQDVLGCPLDGAPLKEGRLQQFAYLPTGFLLIATRVFPAIPRPWFFDSYDPQNGVEPDGYISQDTNFCLTARGMRF
jgi:hypothetical protein